LSPFAVHRSRKRVPRKDVLALNRFREDSFAPMSTVIEHKPAPEAPREVPTPLVFVSSRNLDNYSTTGMKLLSSAYSEKGFSCLEADINFESSTDSSSEERLNRSSSELTSHISSSNNPFPPVLVARSLGCLIAQDYVSSHPVTGLVLISPPPSCRFLSPPSSSDPDPDLDPALLARWSSRPSPGLLPTPLPEFSFEPKFPIVIFALADEVEDLAIQNRLVRRGVEVIVIVDKGLVGGPEGQDVDIVVKLEEWLNSIGV